MSTPTSSGKRLCLRCGSEMEAGTIPDRGHGTMEHESLWRGPRPPGKKLLGLISYQNRGQPRQIMAFRCVSCGTLELVAGMPLS